MKKPKRFHKILTPKIWLGIFLGSLGLVLLFLILFFTIHAHTVSLIFFIGFFVIAAPILYGIFDWNFFKGAMNKKFLRNHKFIDEEPRYHELIDTFYVNVIYDMDALFGAYLRKTIRLILSAFIPAIISLLLSFIAIIV